MILAALILIPLVLGLIAWPFGERAPLVTRWLTLAGNAIDLAIAAGLGIAYYGLFGVAPLAPAAAPWLSLAKWPWIPGLGISVSLGLDGLSLLMVALTAFLGIMSVLCSWTSIKDRVGFFHMNLSLVLAGIYGVFLALDLFLFAFFWELMLVPMYFLIDIWGHEDRHRAAMKFFLFTQIGGLLMLVAIIVLAVVHGMASGTLSFDYRDLLGTPLSPVMGMLLMLGFFAAFAVKLPMFPLHTWLPDAHTEAPTAGSVILAGLLLKTGGYGFIRFVIPLFPQASREFAPIALILAVAGILYGGFMAFGQPDMKRLVAYTSVSHLGFVLLGVYAFNSIALSGAVVQMVSHGISTGALFILVGYVQDRLHTRDLNRMGGLWHQAPRMGAAAMFLAMALVGLPGLVNFIGEFMVLLGAYQVSIVLAVLAGLGLVVAMIYALRMIQLSFHGKPREGLAFPDLSALETGVLYVMIALLIAFGLFPQVILRVVDQVVAGVLATVGGAA